MKYYEVNVGGSISLLGAISRAKCYKIVFSSSATVNGEPQYLPYDELHPTNPVNPYGWTKLMIEEIIRHWLMVNKKRKGIVLRYFNQVGPHQSGQIDEEPKGSLNNLMPHIALVASGNKRFLKIFGNDYETIDGTGLRDYIHIVDLSKAHTKALRKQNSLDGIQVINIGCGQGKTVLGIIKEFERSSGKSIHYEFY